EKRHVVRWCNLGPDTARLAAQEQPDPRIHTRQRGTSTRVVRTARDDGNGVASREGAQAMESRVENPADREEQSVLARSLSGSRLSKALGPRFRGDDGV